MQCCSRNLFFICSYVHQTCVIDRTNNQIKSSPPCQEVIDRMMLDPDCKVSFKFLMKIHRMHKLCWSLFTGKRLNLTAYPRKDIQHMESCQMNNEGLFHFIFIKKWIISSNIFKERQSLNVSYAGIYSWWQWKKGAACHFIVFYSAFYTV